MIRTDITPGAISFTYKIADLNRQVALHSLYDAKTLRDDNGKSMYEDVAITDDEKELIIPFYKEFHGELFPVLSTILLRGNNTDLFTEQAANSSAPNIVWHVADGTVISNGEVIADEYYMTHHLFQQNMSTQLDGHLESAYKYYALWKWFLSINTMPALAQKYHTLYTDEMQKIRSAVRHNNNALTRAKRPHNPF